MSYEEVLRMATLNAAQALGIDEELGNFEKGKYFDALLVDLNTPSKPVDSYSDESFEVSNDLLGLCCG